MKKVAFTVVLCFVIGITFGQKKAVSSAKNEIKRENPNIEDARTFINGALNDPETKDKAETWFIAGSVENKQLDLEQLKTFKGETPNGEIMYPALLKIIPYFEVADSLDQLPDEKGKVKPKHRKDMKAIILANIFHYPNAGIHFYNKEDYKNAFLAFKQYIDIPEMKMFQEDKKPPLSKEDTSYVQIKYNAANMASMIADHSTAIELFTSIKNTGYEENEVYRRLTYEYNQIGDSVNLLNILKEGAIKFPGDELFVMNLINSYIQLGNMEDAITYIKLAIEQKPSDPVLYDALGVIYENTNKPEESIQSYKKALEIEPDNAKVLKHMGMVYHNLAVKARAIADETKDKSLSDSELNKSVEYFRESLPFFEKAFSIDNTDRETIFCLRSVYYTLKMGKEFEKMDALYTNEQ
jgi:tetratricopeptide (TPR) repeat protein